MKHAKVSPDVFHCGNKNETWIICQTAYYCWFHRWRGAQKVSVKNAKCQRKSFPTFSRSLTGKCVSFWLIDTNVGFNDLLEVFHVLLWGMAGLFSVHSLSLELTILHDDSMCEKTWESTSVISDFPRASRPSGGLKASDSLCGVCHNWTNCKLIC